MLVLYHEVLSGNKIAEKHEARKIWLKCFGPIRNQKLVTKPLDRVSDADDFFDNFSVEDFSASSAQVVESRVLREASPKAEAFTQSDVVVVGVGVVDVHRLEQPCDAQNDVVVDKNEPLPASLREEMPEDGLDLEARPVFVCLCT